MRTLQEKDKRTTLFYVFNWADSLLPVNFLKAYEVGSTVGGQQVEVK
jgi:hypothetical protein